MSLKLVKLSKEYQPQLTDMLTEWTEDQHINGGNRSPWAIFRLDFHDFDHYLAHLEIREETPDRVPDSTFFCLDTERDIFVGAVNIRHKLNEGLLLTGGHIGDGIRPSERGKGFGTAMVALALEECRKLGIDRVLMCCDKENPASAATITHNGGVLENEVPEDGGITQRYWIDLKRKTESGMEKRRVRTSAKALVIRDGRLLAVKIRDKDGDFYILPGGGQQAGELLPEAVAREIAEETGLSVRVCELTFVIEGAQGEKSHRVDLVFRVEILGESDAERIMDNDQTGVEWLEIEHLNLLPLYPSRLRRPIMNLFSGLPVPVYLGNENMGDPEITD